MASSRPLSVTTIPAIVLATTHSNTVAAPDTGSTELDHLPLSPRITQKQLEAEGSALIPANSLTKYLLDLEEYNKLMSICLEFKDSEWRGNAAIFVDDMHRLWQLPENNDVEGIKWVTIVRFELQHPQLSKAKHLKQRLVHFCRLGHNKSVPTMNMPLTRLHPHCTTLAVGLCEAFIVNCARSGPVDHFTRLASLCLLRVLARQNARWWASMKRYLADRVYAEEPYRQRLLLMDTMQDEVDLMTALVRLLGSVQMVKMYGTAVLNHPMPVQEKVRHLSFLPAECTVDQVARCLEPPTRLAPVPTALSTAEYKAVYEICQARSPDEREYAFLSDMSALASARVCLWRPGVVNSMRARLQHDPLTDQDKQQVYQLSHDISKQQRMLSAPYVVEALWWPKCTSRNTRKVRSWANNNESQGMQEFVVTVKDSSTNSTITGPMYHRYHFPTERLARSFAMRGDLYTNKSVMKIRVCTRREGLDVVSDAEIKEPYNVLDRDNAWSRLSLVSNPADISNMRKITFLPPCTVAADGVHNWLVRCEKCGYTKQQANRQLDH